MGDNLLQGPLGLLAILQKNKEPALKKTIDQCDACFYGQSPPLLLYVHMEKR
jgi:hypothetical protein